jgi:hypothetical protein
MYTTWPPTPGYNRRVSHRSRALKLAAWTCLLAILVVAATDWSAQALPPPVEALLGRRAPLLVPLGCLAGSPAPSPAQAPRAGRAPPLS